MAAVSQALRIQPSTLATQQNPMVVQNWSPITASGASLTTLATAAHLLTKPSSSSDLTTGLRVVTSQLSLSNRRQLQFILQHATAVDNKTASVRVFGIKRVHCRDARLNAGTSMMGNAALEEEYQMHALLDLSITAGANLIPSGSNVIKRTDSSYQAAYCDGITISADYTRGNSAVVYQEGADNAAVVDFDSAGAEWLVIEGLPGASGTGVWILLGDM